MEVYDVNDETGINDDSEFGRFDASTEGVDRNIDMNQILSNNDADNEAEVWVAVDIYPFGSLWCYWWNWN